MSCYNKLMKNSYSRAFTLIELLVVIAIIGILTSIVMANLSSARSKARDAKRISDIGQIQLALELYYDRCKQYPASGTGEGAVTLSTGFNNNCTTVTPAITLGSYISQIPSSPSPGSYTYYVDNRASPSDYVLSVALENYNEVMKDSLSPTALPLINRYGATCDNNTASPHNYCIGPR